MQLQLQKDSLEYRTVLDSFFPFHYNTLCFLCYIQSVKQSIPSFIHYYSICTAKSRMDINTNNYYDIIITCALHTHYIFTATTITAQQQQQQ